RSSAPCASARTFATSSATRWPQTWGCRASASPRMQHTPTLTSWLPSRREWTRNPRSSWNAAGRFTWRKMRVCNTASNDDDRQADGKGVDGQVANPRPLDPRALTCYFVTGRIPDLDREQEREEITRIAAEAAAGGAGAVQVRSKPITVRQLTELAIRIAAAVAGASPHAVVGQDVRVDGAAERMAERTENGVHLGQDDDDPRLARAVLGAGAIIRLATGTLGLVGGANAYPVVMDYVGAGL